MNQEYIVFFTSISAFVVSVMVFMLKVCFKSKCSDVSFCWGGLKIHRNTEQETQNISSGEIQLSSRISPATLPV